MNRLLLDGSCLAAAKRLVTLLTALAIAAPWPSLAQPPVQIGTSISISGRDAVQGGYVREGYLLCQRHISEKGGRVARFGS